MELGPIVFVPFGVQVAVDPAHESLGLTRELVTAVGWLNQTEFPSRGQELKLRRLPGKRPMVAVVDRETGETIDELSPEEVLRIMAASAKEQEGEQ